MITSEVDIQAEPIDGQFRRYQVISTIHKIDSRCVQSAAQRPDRALFADHRAAIL